MNAEPLEVLYDVGEDTARITAIGPSLHILPREIRKAALIGCTSLDLQACQLAVIAKEWHVPIVLDYLQTGKSIWGDLAGFVGTGPEMKPTLKMGVYALCFGMGLRKLQKRLSDGCRGTEGIGPERASRFFLHPVITAAIEARHKAFRRVRSAGGIEDAFGRWLRIQEDAEVHQLLARHAQSCEQRLMSAALPVLKRYSSDLAVLSWLHDGITLKSHDTTKRSRIENKIIEAVNHEAQNLGYITRMEKE
jgi:hypothetical protein